MKRDPSFTYSYLVTFNLVSRNGNFKRGPKLVKYYLIGKYLVFRKKKTKRRDCQVQVVGR